MKNQACMPTEKSGTGEREAEKTAVARRLLQARREVQLTQKRIGDMIGYSGATVCQNEHSFQSGQKYLDAFCKALRVDPEWVLKGGSDSVKRTVQNQATAADRFSQIRRERELTPVTMGRMIGVSGAQVSAMESGKMPIPEKVMERVETNLGYGREWLIFGDETQKYWPMNSRMIRYLKDHPQKRQEIWERIREEENGPEDTHSLQTPGDRIRGIRTERRIRQTEFALLLGVKQSTVSRLESGEISLSGIMAEKICRVLNVSQEWLLTGRTGEEEEKK